VRGKHGYYKSRRDYQRRHNRRDHRRHYR
jgi:hypothetical protein